MDGNTGVYLSDNQIGVFGNDQLLKQKIRSVVVDPVVLYSLLDNLYRNDIFNAPRHRAT